MTYNCLDNDAKIAIIRFYDLVGPKWTFISIKLNIPPSTIRNFMTRYNKNPKLELQRGRPPKVTKEIKEGIFAKF